MCPSFQYKHETHFFQEKYLRKYYFVNPFKHHVTIADLIKHFESLRFKRNISKIVKFKR
jgi:hypothetical protein